MNAIGFRHAPAMSGLLGGLVLASCTAMLGDDFEIVPSNGGAAQGGEGASTGGTPNGGAGGNQGGTASGGEGATGGTEGVALLVNAIFFQ